jgi:shikimate 5-dehydrogenase
MSGKDLDFEDFGFIDALPNDAVVYDMVYAPKETKLLNYARNRGFKTINGLPMLVCQAAAAFRHFTGKRVEKPLLTEILNGM